MDGCSYHCRGGVPSCAAALIEGTDCVKRNNRIVCRTLCANMRRMCRSRGEYVRFSEPVPLELLDKFDDSKGFVKYRENVSTQDVDAPCFSLSDTDAEDVVFFEGGMHRDVIQFGDEMVLYLADITAKRSMLARNDRRHGVLCLPRAKDYAGTSCTVDANKWVMEPAGNSVETIRGAGENAVREGDAFCLRAIPEHTVPASNAYLCWDSSKKFFYMGSRSDAARMCVPEKACNTCSFDPIPVDDIFESRYGYGDDGYGYGTDDDDADTSYDYAEGDRKKRVRFNMNHRRASSSSASSKNGAENTKKLVQPLLLLSAAGLVVYLVNKRRE